MGEVMIERWNSKLKPGDHLYIVGDISWSTYDWNQWYSRLNTKMVSIVWGNHDDPKTALKKYPWIASHGDIKVIKRDKQKIVLCHYAMKAWPFRNSGSAHCFGHSHGKLKGEGRSLDIGVDCFDFYPVEFSEVIELVKDIPIYVDGKLPEGGEI